MSSTISLSILDSLTHELPEQVVGVLAHTTSGKVSCISFHPSGYYLAGGTTDGWISLWDMRIRAPLVSWKALDGPITSTRWSADGHRIVVSGPVLYMRNLMNPDEAPHIISDSIHSDAEFHPSSFSTILASTNKETVLFQSTENKYTFSTIDASIATFTSDGHFIVAANNHVLQYLSFPTLNLLASVDICCSTPPLTLCAFPNSSNVLLNCGDRFLRIFSSRCSQNTLDLSINISDSISNSHWQTTTISPDGHVVAAGTKTEIVLFDADNGHVLKRMDGSGDGNKQICWNPTRPMLVTISGENLYLWTPSRLPGTYYNSETGSDGHRCGYGLFSTIDNFQLLEENIEYEESENEFDIENTQHTPLDPPQSEISLSPMQICTAEPPFPLGILRHLNK